MNKKKKILIYHPIFCSTFGGSEYLPLLLLQDLQHRGYDVTLVLGDGKEYIASCAEEYEIDVDLKKINIVALPSTKTPFVFCKAIMDYINKRRIKKMAKDFDICISAVNIIDFGKPSHSFITLMLSSSHYDMFSYFIKYGHKSTGLIWLKSNFRSYFKSFLYMLFGLRTQEKFFFDSRENIYVPSRYYADVIHSFYGPVNCTIFHPPTIFEIPPSIQVKRDPLKIVYIGRIRIIKCISDIITIVEHTREISGYNLQLYLAGPMDSTHDMDNLKRIVENQVWIHFINPIYKKNKAAFLLSGTYAIHTMKEEAFGISITEYLKAGCIPIVPDKGGTPEIVGIPDLIYHTNEEASQILTHLLSDNAFRREQLVRCKERAKEFSAERYMELQHKLLDSILGEQT